MAEQLQDFSKLTAHCDELADFYAKRNDNNKEIDQAYFLDWTAPTKDGSEADIKVTISTQPRNAMDGAGQLLTSTEPIWSIERDKNSPNATGADSADILETAAKTMWFMAGRERQKPLEYDAVRLGVRRDEIHIGVMLTKTMLENAKGSSPSNIKRLEYLAKRLPVMWEVYDPSTGFPEWDSYGLAGYYRKTVVKSSRVLDAWGDLAIIGGLKASDRWADVTYCEWIDHSTRAVWIEGQKTPIYYGEHMLPCIPIVCQILNGSPANGMTGEQQVQPLAYGIIKSGLWKSANLYATIADTNALALASNATFIQRLRDPENDAPRADFSTPGGVLRLHTSESQEPMIKNAVDAAIIGQAQRIDQQMEEASIYKATLGQPVGGGNAPYSSVALLNQIGRQPLTSIQKGAGWAFAKAMETAFMLMKDAGGKQKIQGRGAMVDITPDQIPDGLVIDCTLDINLPTDDRQNAMVAAQLVQSGLASREWARSKIIGIGQSTSMDHDIYFEKLEDATMQMRLQLKQQQLQMQMQQMMAQQQAAMQPAQPQPGAEGGQMPPEGMMPPEAMQQPGMAPDQMGAGLPAMPMTEPTNPNGMPPGMGPGPEAAMTGGM